MKRWFYALLFALSIALVVSACGDTEIDDGGAPVDEGNGGGAPIEENESAETEEPAAEEPADEGNAGVSAALQALRDQGYVTVGFANEAPYAYEEDGELKGAAVEIARAVFGELGVDEVRGQLAQWDQLIPSVQAGRFDAITAGMAINPDRCGQVEFSEPTVKYGEGLVVAGGNPLDLHSYEDIATSGATVAVMSGATEYQFLLDSGVSEDQIERVADIAATLDMVRIGRADVTTATEMTVKQAVMDIPDGSLEVVEDFVQPDVPGVPSYGATAFSPDNSDLRDEYNAALKKLRDNGTIADVLDSDILPLWSSTANMPEEEMTKDLLCSATE